MIPLDSHRRIKVGRVNRSDVPIEQRFHVERGDIETIDQSVWRWRLESNVGGRWQVVGFHARPNLTAEEALDIFRQYVGEGYFKSARLRGYSAKGWQTYWTSEEGK